MSTLSLPLFADSLHYDFNLDLEGVTFLMEFRWNARAPAWFWSLYDGDSAPVVVGVKLVLNSDLLARVRDPRRPPGELFLLDTSDLGTDPGERDLGERVVMFYEESRG